MEWIQNEWQEKMNETIKKQGETFWQNADAQRLYPHCQSGDKGACKKIFIDLYDKDCQNGLVSTCADLAQLYLKGGNKQFGIKIDENKAKSYADKVCNLDAVVCASMSRLFMYKNRKLALQYAEKACEMGEPMGCLGAGTFYNFNESEGGIGKNPQKLKYYESKLCKAGVKDFCN